MAGLVRIGNNISVAAPYADRFNGLIRDLQAQGYAIDPSQSGGYNPRYIAGTRKPSNHAFGRAIDINWNTNARGTQGDLPPDVARSLASKYGLKWGGDWRNPDPMHFEVADASQPSQSSPEAPMPSNGTAPLPAFNGMTPNSVAQQRRMAQALLAQGTDASPVQHWTQALARVLQGATGGYQMRQADAAEKQGLSEGNKALASALMGGGDVAQAVLNPYVADQAMPIAMDQYKRRMDAPQQEMENRLREMQIKNQQSNLDTESLRRKQLQMEIDAGGKPKVMDVDGTLVRVMPDGTATPVYQGQPNLTKKPLTEHESKDALFAERMLRAEKDLEGVIPIDEQGNFTSYNPTTWRQNYAPDKPALSNLYTANLINSKEWQQYQRAARESLSAILRKDTGAAVTDEEFNTYFPTYFPIPGDSPEVILQKKRARDQIGTGLKGASGRAYDIMFPPSNNGSGAQSAPPQVEGTKSINGKTYIKVKGQWFEQ